MPTAHPLERRVAAFGAELLIHQWRGLEAAVTPQDPGLGLPAEMKRGLNCYRIRIISLIIGKYSNF